MFVNGDLIDESAVELNLDDQIICDPYILRIIPKPDLIRKARPQTRDETSPNSLSDTNFVLNLPDAKPHSNGTAGDPTAQFRRR